MAGLVPAIPKWIALCSLIETAEDIRAFTPVLTG
jgi:hypothetical protein